MENSKDVPSKLLPLVIRWKTNLALLWRCFADGITIEWRSWIFLLGPMSSRVREEGRRVSLRGVAEEGAGEMRKEEEGLMLLALRRMARKQRVGEALMPRATPRPQPARKRGPQPTTAGNRIWPTTWTSQEADSSQGFLIKAPRQTPWFWTCETLNQDITLDPWTSNIHDSEIQNLNCSNPRGLWSFVTAAAKNDYSHPIHIRQKKAYQDIFHKSSLSHFCESISKLSASSYGGILDVLNGTMSSLGLFDAFCCRNVSNQL